MNDFFSVLDDFEIQEFVSADGESDYTGSSFSIDSYDDASGSTETATRDELVNQEVKLSSVKSGSSTREAINNITESDANKSQSGMVYVWDSGVSPVTGSTGNVYANFVGGSEGTKSFYDADGNVTSTIPYTVVTLNNIAGLSFESAGTLEFDPSLDGNYDMGVQATAGVSLILNRGNIVGGSFLRGDSTLTLTPPENADVEVTTTLRTIDFADNSVSFVAENEDIKSVTTDKANGTIELTADSNRFNYDFMLDGSQVKFKNVTDGTLKATYDEGSLTIDASDLTSETDNLQAVALGDADIFIPPTTDENTVSTVRIGSTNYNYVNDSGNAYFMVDGTTVEGYVLSAAGDAINVTKTNEIDVYDEDDTTKLLANVTGKNYTITKLAEDAYSVNITESSDVVIGDTTFNFTISNTTKGSDTFRNGVTVYFDEDLNVTGVQGLNLFGAGDSMKVTAPNVTEADGGIALINSSRDVQNGNTSGIVDGYVSVSDGDFTYSGSASGIPTIKVATDTQVYSVSDATAAKAANITVGTNGGTVTDGEGDTFNYSGAGSLYGVEHDIQRFNMTAAGDAIQMSTTNPVAVYYDGSAITIPAVVDADGKFTVSMGSDGNFFISDLGAGAKVDDRFTFENAGGTVEFEAEDGDVVAIHGYTGDLTLYQLDTGLTINGDKLLYLFGEDTNYITATCDLNGVTSVSGLNSGDNITSTDEDTKFQFTTTGLTDVFTVNDNTYTVTNDNNGVIYITAGGVVTDLDENATLEVTPAKALNVNGAEFAAEAVDGETVKGFETKKGDISAYVTDGTHPLFDGYTDVDDIKTWIGVAPATTYRESTDGTKDLSNVEGTAQYTFDTVGTAAVAFNDDGKNLAIVDDDATGDKIITLGKKGDAVIMMGRDEYGSVNIIGGEGNDTIFVGGREGVEDAVVNNAGMKTSIDLSKGGVDKVHTYAAANANIILNNYDEKSLAGVVLHDPEIPYIKDLTDAIKEDLIVVDGENQIIAIDRDETRTGVDRKTRITVNNTNSAHKSMVRLFGYKDNKDTDHNNSAYSDDYGQLVGFTGVTGGTLDASDMTESLVLIGNKDGNHSVGSYLKTGTADDTVFAGGMDTIDTGDGTDIIIMDDTPDRKAATVIGGKGAGDAVQNLKSGFEGDIFDVTSYDGKLAYTFTDGLLAIVDESSKSSLGAITDETGQFIEQRFINGPETLYAAIAQEGGTITVTDSDSTVPNYFLANDGAIDFTGFSGDVGLDVDGEDLDYPSAINGVSASIGSAVNTLIGGSGTTIFKGGKGNETLVAGTGESSLYGGGGQNVLIGDTSSVKTGSVEFFNIGIHNGAQNSIVGFEFIENGGSNQATFDNLNLGLADGNEVAGVEANSDGSVSLTIKGGESGAFEKATIADAAGKEMLIDRGTETETVAQIANSVVTVNNSYVDFYAATNDTSGATVQVGNIASTEIWLGGAPIDHDKKVADFNSSKFTVIDARNSGAEALMAGNELSNTIYGGLGTASMWGGEGNANDVMVGGSAHNEYYYEVGNGNDTILSARDGDVIHLGMSLDQVNFEGTEMGANGIVVRFNDGGAGSLYIDGSAEVSFSFDDGTNVKANRQTGQFE